MITWSSVLWNSFWIVGLALLLATFSYNSWLRATAQAEHGAAPQLSPIYNVVGVILVAIGLIATSRTWLERGLWVVLLAAWLAISFGRIRTPASRS